MSPLNRRRFAAMLASIGLSAAPRTFAGIKEVEPEVIPLSRNGWVPNNDRLPVLLYRAAFSITAADPASVFERAFERNGAGLCRRQRAADAGRRKWA
jgi:hypothetical protein